MFISETKTLSLPDTSSVMDLVLIDEGRSLLICQDKSVTEWNASSWDQTCTHLTGSRLERLAVSHDETFFAVGDSSGRILVKNRVHHVFLPFIQWHVRTVADLLFTRDERLLVASFGSSIWDPRKGRKLSSSFEFDIDNIGDDEEERSLARLNLTVNGIKELSDETLVSCSSDGYVRIIREEAVTSSFRAADCALTVLDTSIPNHVVLGTEEGEVILVDLVRKQECWRTKVNDEWIADLLVQPAMKAIVAVGETLSVLDVESGEIRDALSLEDDPGLCGAVSPLGRLYVGLHYNGLMTAELDV